MFPGSPLMSGLSLMPPQSFWLSGKLVGTSMRSKDFAKAAGLAVVFDPTAHTFYRVSHPNAITNIKKAKFEMMKFWEYKYCKT